MERKLFYKMVYVYDNSWELFSLTCKENEEFTDTVFREVTTTAMDWSGRLAWKELIGGGGGGWLKGRDKRRPNPAKLGAENAESHWADSHSSRSRQWWMCFNYLFIPLVSHIFVKGCLMQLRVINTKWNQIKTVMMRRGKRKKNQALGISKAKNW